MSSLLISENEDINVMCGTEYMALSVFLCPVYHAFYNETLMVLNNEFNNPECFGEADWSANPPALKFKFPITESSVSSCSNNFKVFFHICLHTNFPSDVML